MNLNNNNNRVCANKENPNEESSDPAKRTHSHIDASQLGIREFVIEIFNQKIQFKSIVSADVWM